MSRKRTPEQKIKRRETYAKENARRRRQYAEIVKATGSYKIAQKHRANSVENITETFKNIRVKSNTRIIYYYKPVDIGFTEVPIKTKTELRKIKRAKRRKEARDLGYTPDEADYLRGVSDEKWKDLVDKRVVVDSQGRIDRWSSMSRRKKFEQRIIEGCEEINLEAGYDPNSRYGWAVYYYWYTQGGNIDNWKSYIIADVFDPDYYIENDSFKF